MMLSITRRPIKTILGIDEDNSQYDVAIDTLLEDMYNPLISMVDDGITICVGEDLYFAQLSIYTTIAGELLISLYPEIGIDFIVIGLNDLTPYMIKV
jgi:hypothetical protein